MMLRAGFLLSPCTTRWQCCPLISHSLHHLSHSKNTHMFIPTSGLIAKWRCSPVKCSGSGRAKYTSSSHNQVMFFADAGLNRAAEKRSNQEWLFHAFSSPEALFVPVLESKSLISGGRPAFISTAMILKDVSYQHESDLQPIFLGLKSKTGVPIFTLDINGISSEEWTPQAAEWVDLRKYGPELAPSEAGLLAYARGMVEWQSRNRFCGCCGQKMLPTLGGHSLKCSSNSCGISLYPRLDPAIIVLTTCGDYVLLGRQARWEQGRYSLLAGFVEVGESFEQAVAREVKEECNIDIDTKTVRYAGSQPWPFPSSLMVGFTAEALCPHSSSTNHEQTEKGRNAAEEVASSLTGNILLPKISVDTTELEDAHWFHKDFLKSAISSKKLPYGTIFHVPGQHAIARILMERWISGTVTWAGEDIPTVQIDEGIFKYVLILLKDDKGNEKLVIGCSI